MSVSISFLVCNSTQIYECLFRVPFYAAIHYRWMSGFGNPYIYRPRDVFTAMGCCWVLEDEFNYPIDPNLRNSVMRINKHSRIHYMFQLGLLLEQDPRRSKKYLMSWFKRFGLILTQSIPSLAQRKMKV